MEHETILRTEYTEVHHLDMVAAVHRDQKRTNREHAAHSISVIPQCLYNISSQIDVDQVVYCTKGVMIVDLTIIKGDVRGYRQQNKRIILPTSTRDILASAARDTKHNASLSRLKTWKTLPTATVTNT